MSFAALLYRPQPVQKKIFPLGWFVVAIAAIAIVANHHATPADQYAVAAGLPSTRTSEVNASFAPSSADGTHIVTSYVDAKKSLQLWAHDRALAFEVIQDAIKQLASVFTCTMVSKTEKKISGVKESLRAYPNNADWNCEEQSEILRLKYQLARHTRSGTTNGTKSLHTLLSCLSTDLSRRTTHTLSEVDSDLERFDFGWSKLTDQANYSEE